MRTFSNETFMHNVCTAFQRKVLSDKYMPHCSAHICSLFPWLDMIPLFCLSSYSCKWHTHTQKKTYDRNDHHKIRQLFLGFKQVSYSCTLPFFLLSSCALDTRDLHMMSLFVQMHLCSSHATILWRSVYPRANQGQRIRPLHLAWSNSESGQKGSGGTSNGVHLCTYSLPPV